MKISMQIIYFFASLVLVLFVPCFAFVPTTVADPGGPEGGFTYYLAAWDGSSTYSDGKFFLTNDLRGSTLVDLENDANGYLPIIFDFGVPIYGNPDGTGFPVISDITLVDVQKSSDSSSIPGHGVVIERVSPLHEPEKFLVDIRVPNSLFDDLPITVILEVPENTIYNEDGVGNVAYGPIELNIFGRFSFSVKDVSYYSAAWDGSPTYSDGKFLLGNDLRVSTLVDLENDANGYLPIIFDFGVPIYGNPDGTGFPVISDITLVDVQKSSDSSSIPGHGVVIERVSPLPEPEKLLVDIRVPNSLFDDLPITVILEVPENTIYNEDGVGNVAYGPIELNIFGRFSFSVKDVSYYLAAWDGSPTYSDGKFLLGNDLRVSTLVDLENDANGYLPIIFDFGVPIYGNPDGTGFPVISDITLVEVQKSSDSSSIPDHGVVIERVSPLPEPENLLVDIRVPNSLFDDLPITVILEVPENAIYNEDGMGNVSSVHSFDIVASFSLETGPEFVVKPGDPPTTVAQNRIIFNEIRNADDNTHDWLEIKNISQDDIPLGTWEISIINSADTDYSAEEQVIIGFPDYYTLQADKVLLIVSTPARNTDLILGQDTVDPNTDPKLPNQTIYSPRFSLPDSPYLLILRSVKEQNNTANAIEDITGGFFLTSEIDNTNIWPLKNTPSPSGKAASFIVDGAWQRVNSSELGYLNSAWMSVGYQSGLGYRPKAPKETSIGTPGYPISALVSKVETGQIGFSEIMFASTGDETSLPQWIELFNTSVTQAVDMKDWQLSIKTSKDETHHWKSVITLKDLQILPKQTVLLVTGSGRHSAHIPNHRVYDLSHHHNDVFELGLHQNRVLGTTGFVLQLFSSDGTLVDTAGNLDSTNNSSDTPLWKLPWGQTKEGARTSLIRRYENGLPLPGTVRDSWRIAGALKLTINFYWGSNTDIGTPGYRKGGPLPVTLSHFKPFVEDNGEVVIRWTTESEVDNAGFNIYRSTTRDGPFKKVNPKLILGAGTTGERTTYMWKDVTAKSDALYYYRIEDVSFDGKHQVLATSRLKGVISVRDKLTTQWGQLKFSK